MRTSARSDYRCTAAQAPADAPGFVAKRCSRATRPHLTLSPGPPLRYNPPTRSNGRASGRTLAGLLLAPGSGAGGTT